MHELTQAIAAELGEHEPSQMAVIDRLIGTVGEARTLALLEEMRRIESNGGMLINNQIRRRTPGGVFFKLAKENTNNEERQIIFPYVKRSNKGKGKRKTLPPLPSSEEMQQLSNEALKLTGEAGIVKMTIIGRPGRVIEKGSVIIAGLQSNRAPDLPKGLPKPPDVSTTYIIYIAMKQWRKVRGSIENNPDDKLIVEGYPVFDKRLGKDGVMTVYAQMATTKLIQNARRQAQK